MADILLEGGKFYCTGVMAVNIFIHSAVLRYPLVGDDVCIIWIHRYRDSCFSIFEWRRATCDAQ